MELEIEQGWKNQLNEQFESSNFKELIGFVKSAYKSQTVYPPSNLVFEAFNRCTFENTKVVIIGQDPYHGPGQANGLCFSVGETVAFPPSLKNIFRTLDKEAKDGKLAGKIQRFVGVRGPELSFYDVQGVQK